eukprot:CAMPEP_0182923840 /NCGR_PEP_ID=MMETSP0105_2-20130417/5682_1 /TAXON_ID=81532 ORGANISM="Acanthoeca-like sp., Strain 10tr" /NCGR_SAMPLE_ID=MMETSP0105_2 /ASSEMBLY_ACC=CAM_ASM_000205 /LENGTH=498 /DNA_ID=CAMNT_0025061579 /DNA_START=56 /DNA_END=1552 /DNA_ORIENTATION=-
MSLGKFRPEGPFETRLFINNEFVNAASAKTFPTVNPATEKVVAEVAEADAADVDIAVSAAKSAFDDGQGVWPTMTGPARRDVILKLAQLIEDNVEYLSSLESLDSGKPYLNEAYSAQVDLALVIKCYRYYAGWADKIQGKMIPIDVPDMFAYTRHEPIGVCGQIIPWNFPLLMMAWKLAPALACGNVVVLKTSEKTPLSALAVCKLVKEAGFPPGAVNVLSGFGPTAGAAIAKHMDVDKVAFTGSTPVGKAVASMAAESNLKKTSLELGGKSPLIVMPDADLDQAVQAAHIGLFLNQGQCCIASSRLYVHEDVYDEFVAKATAAAENWTTGDPMSSSTLNGAQVDKIQFDKILRYIAAGKSEGATLKCGGQRFGDKGYFIEPTVFADVKDDMKIAREEIFGPVMSILKFRTSDEAIRRANGTHYGLGAGVISRDIGTALSMAHRLRAGTVYVNTYDVFDTAMPFGGFKQSGVGRELGEYGLEEYTEVKTVVVPLDAKL